MATGYSAFDPTTGAWRGVTILAPGDLMVSFTEQGAGWTDAGPFWWRLVTSHGETLPDGARLVSRPTAQEAPTE